MSDDLGRWRRIYSNEWHAGPFQGLSDPERVVYFYLRTGPQSTSIGIFRVSGAMAAEDIGNLTAVEFDVRLTAVADDPDLTTLDIAHVVVEAEPAIRQDVRAQFEDLRKRSTH
jgi:hypothetical protein